MKTNYLQKRLVTSSLFIAILFSSSYSYAVAPEFGTVYNPAKQFDIAEQLIKKNTHADFVTSLKWLKLSAAQQYPQALSRLGFYYEFGIDGVEQNEQKAAQLYEQAARKGHIAAQFSLSVLLLDEESAVHDPKQGQFWLRQAARNGYPQAQYSLAVHYHNQENNDPAHLEKVIYWMTKSANNNEKEAQYTLGTWYLQGHLLPKHTEKALHWFKSAATQGDALSQYNIGLMYELGEGIAQDCKKSTYWYEKAAAQGVEDAQFNLGKKYLMGQGTEQQIEKGLRLVTQAADAGIPAAQTLLANHFLMGMHLQKDYSEAFKLYFEAARKHNYPEAQYRLSVMFAKGQGVTQDNKKSVHWISKAAKANHAMAQYGLGAYFANGVGIEKDLFQAAYWLSLAAMQGQTHALKSRDTVIKQLNKQERDTLKKKIRMVTSPQATDTDSAPLPSH